MDDEVRRAEHPGAAESADDQISGSEVDWDAALDVTGGDVELLLEVLKAFQLEMPQQLALIHRSLDARDARELHRAAHTIKNGCLNLGAQVTGDIAFELEKIFGAVPPLLARLEAHLQQIDREVLQFLREHGQG